MIPPLIAPPQFRIIAHRGASAYAPENTLAAFDLALGMGVREFETDTQLSTDGKVVLCHDASLARYGHGPRLVEEMAWQELAQLDMGSWFSPYLFRGARMILLEDLFSKYQTGVTYHIEIKGKAAALPAAVCRLLDMFALGASCFVTSFTYASLAAVHTISPELRLGWLVESIDEAALDKAAALNLYQLCPRARNITPAAVQQAHQTVPEVRAWGFSGEPQIVLGLIRHAVDAGCDGATLNWPDWVMHA